MLKVAFKQTRYKLIGGSVRWAGFMKLRKSSDSPVQKRGGKAVRAEQLRKEALSGRQSRQK